MAISVHSSNHNTFRFRPNHTFEFDILSYCAQNPTFLYFWLSRVPSPSLDVIKYQNAPQKGNRSRVKTPKLKLKYENN